LTGKACLFWKLLPGNPGSCRFCNFLHLFLVI
jgi:hypothetical protein